MNRKRYVMNTAHKDLRGFAYLIYSAISLSLLMVMVFLPLAPLFADEIVMDEPTVTSVEESVVPDFVDLVPETEEQVVESEQQDLIEDVAIGSVIDEHNKSELTQGDSDTVLYDATQSGEDPVPVEEITSSDTSGNAVTEEGDIADVEVIEENTEAVSDEAIDTEVAEEASNTSDEVEDIEIIDETVEELLEETDGEQVGDIDEEQVNETEETISDTEEENDISDEESKVHAVATSSDTENVIMVNTLTNDSNKFSFAENECTTAGDGTFYCVKAEHAPEIIHTDRIFSAIDIEGDKEIYVEKDSEISPLTSNQYDDDAPYYDEVSNTAVWHRLIDGRYQIISFDFDKEEETQLTNDRFNNMEPNRFGSATVWQGWVGNDWEIFFFEGGELTMLTDNTINDITPSVNGAYVVWQSFENSAWVMKVYDIRSRTTATIDDKSGGSIENPRFVLVYDSKQMTGDVETKGYDLKSGKVIALGSSPVNLPEEIPDPDQTGEERALVTIITQLKPKTEDDGGGDEPLPDAVGTSTPSDTDLFITPNAIEFGTTTLETVEGPTATSSTDVIVPAIITVDSVDTSHIEDIIVTTYVEPIASTTLAQEMIVSEE
ncbi:MAG: hypothetical protein NUW00_04820 [Candidatus Kaiserbacteria bacterium]|nr:hypothetical protein [Candidatus Kaiserbacteria bacterium]